MCALLHHTGKHNSSFYIICFFIIWHSLCGYWVLCPINSRETKKSFIDISFRVYHGLWSPNRPCLILGTPSKHTCAREFDFFPTEGRSFYIVNNRYFGDDLLLGGRHVHFTYTRELLSWQFIPATADSKCIPPQIVRFMGPTWGPSGADRIKMGPMLAPWTLLSGTTIKIPMLVLVCDRLSHIQLCTVSTVPPHSTLSAWFIWKLS